MILSYYIKKVSDQNRPGDIYLVDAKKRSVLIEKAAEGLTEEELNEEIDLGWDGVYGTVERYIGPKKSKTIFIVKGRPGREGWSKELDRSAKKFHYAVPTENEEYLRTLCGFQLPNCSRTVMSRSTPTEEECCKRCFERKKSRKTGSKTASLSQADCSLVSGIKSFFVLIIIILVVVIILLGG